ncbi:MAG: transketolase [Alphaproteobacteria bacterium]|nr:transketolase [Alphaproteobacteria bacterium]
MRQAFIATLCELAKDRGDIVLVCGDLGFSVLEAFADRFPERFLNVGVAEQNMMGVAAGLAASGKTVFTYSIANFAVARCLEQFRNDVCGQNLPVIGVSVGAGAAYGAQGYTHHGIEDVTFTRGLPEVAVISPADLHETRWAVRRLLERRGPASLRLGRGGEPPVHDRAIEAPFGKAIMMRAPGRDATILCSGSPLAEAVAAANRLAAGGYEVGLLSVPTVTPLDVDAIADASRISRLLVSVEEHVVEGGFGGAVAEVIAGLPCPKAHLLRTGIARHLSHLAADQREVRRIHGFDAEGIVRQVEALLRREAT